MSDLKITRLDIVDDQPDKPEDKILETYYLLGPNEEKLKLLKDAIENQRILNGISVEGLWDIEDYIKQNFQTINIERTEIKW